MKHFSHNLFILVLIITCVLVIAGLLISEQPPHFETDTYVIQSGDTLWNIASQYCPSSMDIRDYVQLLKSKNNISSSIFPGQEIVIFVTED